MKMRTQCDLFLLGTACSERFPSLLPQLTSYLGQEEEGQQAPVLEAEETASLAGYAAATEEVEPGHGGDVQGGASSRAPTEPPPGPVPAAAGAHDEPPGEDDPASRHCISHMGSERCEGSGKTIKCIFFVLFFIGGHCLTYNLVEYKKMMYFILAFQVYPIVSKALCRNGRDRHEYRLLPFLEEYHL